MDIHLARLRPASSRLRDAAGFYHGALKNGLEFSEARELLHRGVRANQTTQETSSVSCGGAVAGGGTAAVIAHALKAVDLRGRLFRWTEVAFAEPATTMRVLRGDDGPG
jgi:hypothetical protein